MIHKMRSAPLWFAMFLVGCSGGGGPAPAPAPDVGAVIPIDSGKVVIQMTGTWEIRNAVVVDTNSPNPVVPLNGTPIVLDGARIVSIGGLSVARADLEALLGPLSLYVNQANGRTLLYGIGLDRFAQGLGRERVGVAGGSINDATITIEAYSSTQADAAAPEVFVRSRYTLAKIAQAAPSTSAVLDIGEVAQRDAVRAALRAAFGGN